MSVDEKTETDFEEIRDRAEAGSHSAIAELVGQYSPQLLRIIRRRLRDLSRRTIDSEDVVQSVWTSFFTNNEKLGTVKTETELKALLNRMASNKAIDQGRKYFSRRNQVALKTVPLMPDGQNQIPLPSGDPTPSEELMARECVSTIAQSVPEKFAHIIRMRAEGNTIEEISKELDISPRAVHRVLKHALNRLIK